MGVIFVFSTMPSGSHVAVASAEMPPPLATPEATSTSSGKSPVGNSGDEISPPREVFATATRREEESAPVGVSARVGDASDDFVEDDDADEALMQQALALSLEGLGGAGGGGGDGDGDGDDGGDGGDGGDTVRNSSGGDAGQPEQG